LSRGSFARKPFSSADQLVAIDRLEGLPRLEEVSGDRVDFGESQLGELAQGAEEIAHLFTRQPVGHIGALPLGFDQARGVEEAKVLGGVGDTLAGLSSQGLDSSRTLAQEVEKLQAGRAGDGLTQPGKLVVDCVFELAVGESHLWSFSTIQRKS
jgi:hypothetical protein